jgi:hypothetical protein
MKNKHILFALIATVLAAFIVSGCVTARPLAAVGGYPLIDIVDAEVDLADDSEFALADDFVWKSGPNTKKVSGTLGSRIVAKDLSIKLIETSIQVPIRRGADLSSWFLNIPQGLKATAYAADPEAKFAVEKDATEVTVTFEGVPEQTINQPIKIRVPYEVTNRSWDFDIPANPDIRFEIYGVDVDGVVVGGAVNRDIDSKTFKIKFGGTRLAAPIAADTDLSAWFTNIPRGLKAVTSEETVPATEGQQSITVTVSGRPTVQVNEKIIVVIPSGVTEAGIVLAIPPSEKAKYDIGSYSTVSATDTELRNGTNWKGVQTGWGLTGPEVFRLKDFTPVGIIQIKSESVYAIGEDGAFHWTGEDITYGKLMAEAKSLNAHAIIDVVIDSDDEVSETVERRHVEANHVPSALELKKIAAKIIKEEVDPNGGTIFVETVQTIKRTSTGTALAIQYAPAYQPAVGGAGTGYVPAVPNNEDTAGKK